MKELNSKTHITIFLLISLFLITSIMIYNIQIYRKEYTNISESLNIIENFKNRPNSINNSVIRPEREIDNMIFMDYEVYTVKLNNNTIDKIIGHSNNESHFDIENIAKSIINEPIGINIGNLYNSKYVYNHKTDTIIIINTESINSKLSLILVESLLVFALGEVLIYFISMLITKWITKPAIDSFNRQKDFIADASHELKTPLAVIMASSDELKGDKKNSQYIENIKYESERMNKLITSLLDLSKLENGVLINTYKEENISKIVEKVSLTFDSIAYESNISIDTDIEKNIMFKCSSDEIEKLISIIIDNAIKHSYKDTTVLVKMYKDKNNINIDITNIGDPIITGDEEKIFERFYRADKSRNRDSNRYGLGLAIAKNIVTNHKGIIKAYSKDTKTTFKIILKK